MDSTRRPVEPQDDKNSQEETPSTACPKTELRADSEVPQGFGRYRIERRLGQGGMGEVYLALQPALNRKVALKILSKELREDPEFVQRFNREAQALARLSHPHIVPIFDFGEESGQYHFVMEFVEGENLRRLLQQGGLEPERATELVRQLTDALAYAHEEGIVHRDIKPENILIDKKGRVKIADFGLARIAGGQTGTSHLTQSGMVMGTPHYMAPEQVESPTQIDHRADLYALGVVFYEMLTGQLPIGRFEPPSKRLEVDAGLDGIILKLLERDPARRYQQAVEVRRDLQRYATQPGALGEARPPKRPERRPGRWVAWGSVLVALGGVAFFVGERFIPGPRWIPRAWVEGIAFGLGILGLGGAGWAWRGLGVAREAARAGSPCRAGRLRRDRGRLRPLGREASSDCPRRRETRIPATSERGRRGDPAGELGRSDAAVRAGGPGRRTRCRLETKAEAALGVFSPSSVYPALARASGIGDESRPREERLYLDR